MASLPDDVAQFIDEPNLAIFTTLMRDGSPQATMVWVDREDDYVVVNTPTGSQKDRNLARDQRVAICVIDREQPQRYVQIRGRVVETITGDEAWQHINHVSQKYSGRDYPRPQERTKIIIEPEHVSRLAPRRADGEAGGWR